MSLPHVNLRKLWAIPTGHNKKASELRNALCYHGLEFEGHLRRGKDDAHNMARLLPFIGKRIRGHACHVLPIA